MAMTFEWPLIIESWKNVLWSPQSWALESGIQLKESGIQNPSSTDEDWNQMPG